MPIPVACVCGAKFAAKDELAGKAVKCPKCGQPLKIPAAGGAPAAEAPAPAAKKPAAAPSPAKPAATKPQAPKPKPEPVSSVADIFDEIGIVGSKTGIKCPKCNADMQEGAVICITCGFNTKTGKQTATESDSKSVAKREEIYRKQREAADAKFKASGGVGSGSSYASQRESMLPIIRDGASTKAAFATAWQILFNPARTFSELPPRDGVGHAVSFVLTCASSIYGAIALLWGGGMVLMVLIAIAFNPQVREAVSQHPDRLALGLGYYLLGIGIVFAIAMITTAIWMLLNGALFSIGSHLILKHAGGSTLGFGAAFQCFLYVAGVAFLIGCIPFIGGPIALVIFPLYLGLAFHYHHEVTGGISALAVFVGLVLQILVITLIVLIAGTFIVAGLQQLGEQLRSPSFQQAPP